MDRQNQKLKGALLTFVVLQLCYLFCFFLTFPDSFRNTLNSHTHALVAAASWLSMITMLAYCIISLMSVAQLVMRKHTFLRWFQISGAIALVGNFVVFVLRQVADSIVVDYGFFNSGDYYWTLFIMALFWTVIWCMYFARSSRLYSFMDEDATYLRMAFFTKKVKEPMPWPDYRPFAQTASQPPQNMPHTPPHAPIPQPVQARQPVQPVPYPPVGTPQPVQNPGVRPPVNPTASTTPGGQFQPIPPTPNTQPASPPTSGREPNPYPNPQR